MSVDLAASRLKAWRNDTALFARECFAFTPDEWQMDVFRAFDGNQPVERIAMQACAGPGKSAVMAILGLKSLACHADRGKFPNGFALSITGDNLRDGLWKELAVWYNRSEFFRSAFEFTSTSIHARDYPETWWLRARAYPKTADPETQGRALDGLHAPYIFYLLDETGGMHPALLRKAEQGLNNCEWGRLVLAGNPTTTSGALHTAVNDHAGSYRVIRITGDPDDPKRSPRINLEWARTQIAQYGRDNPWVQSYILGLFPAGALNTLLTADEVRAAMDRSVPEDAYDWSQKRLGIDVARFGDDRTVLWPRQGLVAFRPSEMRQQNTNAIAAKALNIIAQWQAQMTFVDDTGHWGHGVVDNLLTSGASVIPVNFADRQTNQPRYFNKRAEMWFEMADWVKRGGCLPNMPELIPEFTVPTYYFQDGKVRLVEKDEIKKLLDGRSPDYADALALTFALPDMPGGFTVQEGLAAGRIIPGFTGQGTYTAPDYDPFDPRRF